MQARGDVRGGASTVARAARGVEGSGGSLPYLETIQSAFGKHDLGAVQAHTGTEAAAAAGDIGARAYAMGSHIAFAGAPDLHTAAHEAAHVIQQRAGVHLKDGVGRAGDEYEQHADAVADLVVQGRSAEALLDSMAGPIGAVQMLAVQCAPDPIKPVSKSAGARLPQASAAIAYTKAVLKFGAGNQFEAIKATDLNSRVRLNIMRTDKYWVIDPSVQALADANYEALTLAKANIAHGGNCGEHAQIAFNYLRATAVGTSLSLVAVAGLDHNFILMGYPADSDSDVTVADPWPTAAKACLWEDHFAFTADRTQIQVAHQMVADGKDLSGVIQLGVKLTPEGLALLTQKGTPEQVKDQLDNPGDHHIWQQPNANADGHAFQYGTPAEVFAKTPTGELITNYRATTNADEKTAFTAEIAKRAITVHVLCKSTDDWTQADDVYAVANAGAGNVKSAVAPMNNGQSHDFSVPIAGLAPFGPRIVVKVFDEELIGSDDMLMSMAWSEPYKTITSDGKSPKGDYVVTLQFDR